MLADPRVRAVAHRQRAASTTSRRRSEPSSAAAAGARPPAQVTGRGPPTSGLRSTTPAPEPTAPRPAPRVPLLPTDMSRNLHVRASGRLWSIGTISSAHAVGRSEEPRGRAPPPRPPRGPGALEPTAVAVTSTVDRAGQQDEGDGFRRSARRVRGRRRGAHGVGGGGHHAAAARPLREQPDLLRRRPLRTSADRRLRSCHRPGADRCGAPRRQCGGPVRAASPRHRLHGRGAPVRCALRDGAGPHVGGRLGRARHRRRAGVWASVWPSRNERCGSPARSSRTSRWPMWRLSRSSASPAPRASSSPVGSTPTRGTSGVLGSRVRSPSSCWTSSPWPPWSAGTGRSTRSGTRTSPPWPSSRPGSATRRRRWRTPSSPCRRS